MFKIAVPFLLLSFHVCVFADPLRLGAGVYYNQAQFQDAVAPLGQISIDDFDQGQIHLPGLSVSSDIPFDGLGIGAGNGQLTSDGYVETTSKYSVTTWTFRDPIYAFAGFWNLGQVNAGLQIISAGQVYFMPDGIVAAHSSYPSNWSGFWGFVSDTPVDSVSISAGDEGPPSNFGQSYSLSGLEVVSTPEPGSLLLVTLALGVALTVSLRRQRGAGDAG